jgi:hypothetical protein
MSSHRTRHFPTSNSSHHIVRKPECGDLPSSAHTPVSQSIASRRLERALHVVDIENLIGSGFCRSEKLIKAALQSYRSAAKWQPGDLMVISANQAILGTVAFAASSFPCLVRGAQGKDGADLVLLDHTNQQMLLNSVHRLVIGSGDGIFTQLVETAHRVGTPAWVIASRRSTSDKLLRACDHYVPFQLYGTRGLGSYTRGNSRCAAIKATSPKTSSLQHRALRFQACP